MKDEYWTAIISNDAAYDEQFFYAVKTTGIFCRPSCKSRVPNRGNVRIFRSANEALREEFRPCKRCKPTGERLPDEDWVEQITTCIQSHYKEKLTLHMLADMCHGSPYHLHRTFKRITGVTPVEYIQSYRVGKAKEILMQTTSSVHEVAYSVGIPSAPYFITLFKKITGYSPAEYRQKYKLELMEEPI
ncbi:bifunctional transcriptional activator/DNA repair enzyme AdaA [Paenibacillus tuaregi]|uniref:bifunctional transcriptional activator/DNA repair enzyme AdaA n=1 Tax=Paenibacillus tuaregi TaxID=1816681 RepID=UPI000AF218DE|nr:bifunctional transcriptional activator/DNA repair enzyme AdaA [Paenibacillus tuaregi]